MENWKDSHKKGFGSSDAANIISFAKSGKMNSALKKRIDELRGFREPEELSLPIFDEGLQTENAMYELLLLQFPDLKSNPLKYRNFGFRNFTTFNHIDFISDENRMLFECKHTKFSPEDTLQKYAAQMAWHRLIIPGHELFLVHVDRDTLTYTLHEVPDTSELEDYILKALFVLDEYMDENKQPYYHESKNVHDFTELIEIDKEIKRLEKRREELKNAAIERMQGYGLEKVSNDDYSVTLIGGSERITTDWAKLAQDAGLKSTPDYEKKTTFKPQIRLKY